jgi:hypothetical protein
MSWSDEDNKKYRGKIDRIFVSRTEYYEVRDFIEHYLKSRNYDLTDENRQKVSDKMHKYPGPVPVQREALESYMDEGWKT